jgi:DNA-binding MarR family transcriptional regulator
MAEYLPEGSALNDLMRECFRLNRSLVDAAQKLTDGAGITGAQWGVLTALGQGGEPRTVAETARQMSLARQSVQRVTDLLVDNGLVEYLPSPEDKRAKLADVTKAGRALLAKLERRQRDWVDSIVADRSDADVRAATELVKEIRGRISEPES